MEKLFDGLYLHDIVLIVLGSILFFVVLFMLLYNTIKQRSIKSFLPFLLVPVIMIGYPGFQSMSFMGDILNIEKLKNQVAQDPTNETAKRELAELLDNVENRPIRSAETMIRLSRAYEVIGNIDRAEVYADAALAKDPLSDDAQQLRRKIDLQRDTEILERDPGNTTAKDRIVENLSWIEHSQDRSVNTLVSVARAYQVLGDTTRASEVADSITIINPRMNSRQIFGRGMVHVP
jgi:tetratricopeptide (TPR) repeat protein